MDWQARGAWIYEGGAPDYAKIAAHKIGVVYIDPRSPNADAVVADLRAHGITAGAYVCSSWKDTTPATFAKWASDLLNHAVPKGSLPEAPPAMLDLEGVTKTWTASMVAAYRTYQPARPTAYTNEPYKDGTVVPITALLAAGLHWYPQLYYGDMAPADPAAVLLEVIRWSYPPAMVHPFYDGAHLPGDARDGCVYTLERLP